MNDHAVNLLLAARQHLVQGHTREALRVMDQAIVELNHAQPVIEARPVEEDL